MAQQRRGKGRTKAKSNRRAQNAFEIAEKQLSSKYEDSASDSDGAIVNPRKKYQNNDENESDEFEDEELESDEALGSDDDFDVMNSKFSQTLRDKAKAKKNGEGNISEEEDAYDSIDESELVPLSAVWDLDDKDSKQINGKAVTTEDIILDDSDEDSDNESELSDESDGDSEEEEFPFDDEENVEYEEDEVELTNLKNKLLKKEKKAKKHYQNLDIEENELSLPGGTNDITLADMLSVVDPNSSKKAILIDKEQDDDVRTHLPIPLPKRIQDRHERKAAYEITKDEVNKWKDIVKQNREADVLSFPLNKPVVHNAASTFNETSSFNDLEAKINGVLKESSLLDDKKESKFEEIATAKMSAEELHKRQNELRKMRELMFRQEREAKRIKKIKSKSYRRIKKKELLKNKALIEGEESDDEEHDIKRAQERMSLKHKNNSSWSKNMIKSGMSKDEDAREEMEEMLRRGQSLRSKILDRDDDDDEFGDTHDLDLDKDVDYGSETEERERLGKTGVLNMAFMKNAEARERTRNEETKASLRKLNAEEDIKEFEESASSGAVDKSFNSGRRVYTAGAQSSNKDLEEINRKLLEDHETDISKGLTSRLNKNNKKTNITEKEKVDTELKDDSQKSLEEDSNPWLLKEGENVHKSRKIKVIDQNSSKLEKNRLKSEKQQKKRKANQMDDADEDVIDMNQTLKIVDPYGENSGDEADDSNILMFKQQDLIREAFAGDDVVNEFKAEKKQQIKNEADQVEDLTLPGWGDWAGGNAKKPKKNKIVKKTKGVEFNKRKDKNLQNVIINEKINKKNVKYQSSAVPFPFENREQYERSLRMPIGQEWTSRETHQRLTMPKVITKTGAIIDPLKAPFK